MTLGFYFDGNFCTGCKTCVVACKDVKNLGVGEAFRRVLSFETGAYPRASAYHYSMACNHCASPACVATCPTGAMAKAEDGTVQHDDAVCIGCQTCVKSCPYGVPQLIEAENIVRKCDACADRRGAGLNPSCVDACPMRCLEFGNVEELEAKYGPDLVRELPFLPSSEETGPSVLINPKAASTAEDYRELVI